jgi:hypothetical protein
LFKPRNLPALFASLWEEFCLKEEEEEKKNKKKREELVRGHCNFGLSKKGLFCLDSVNLVDFFFWEGRISKDE